MKKKHKIIIASVVGFLVVSIVTFTIGFFIGFEDLFAPGILSGIAMLAILYCTLCACFVFGLIAFFVISWIDK